MMERLAFQLAWRLPRSLVYFCGIRLWANASSGPFSAETPVLMPMDTILDRWEHRTGGDPSHQ